MKPAAGKAHREGRVFQRVVAIHTKAWIPSCECGHSSVQCCTVLEPFLGSGTTGVVALRHGRSSIGIELNPQSLREAGNRIREGLGGRDVLMDDATRALLRSPRQRAVTEYVGGV
jgi:16S rRNA G966 N2-methylase RsmD